MVNVRPLSEDLQKNAIEQLHEVPDRIAADLEALKTWIQQQPYLKARTDDQFLLAFLRGCKFSMEKTKVKLDKYYTFRSQYRESFCPSNVDDPIFREVLKKGMFLGLPNPLPSNGTRLFFMRWSVVTPGEYSLDDLFKVLYAMQDIIMIEDDHSIVNGITIICDLKDSTAAHFLQMGPREMKRRNTYIEEAIPFRPKALHYVNAPSALDYIFNMFKPMLSEKIQKRMHIHGNNIEPLYTHIPKEYLLKEYGGENGSVPEIIAHWEKKFDEYREYFKQEEQFGADEKLRPGKPVDLDGVFGTEGSFRKLEVD